MSIEKGKFIVIEGPDASGKGTIVDLLKQDYPHFYYTREPGGTKVGERIREVILDKELEMSPLTEAYLYAASRSAFVKHVKEKLAEGKTVICERYVYSSYIYQGMAGEVGLDLVKKLNDPILDELKPDILFFLLVQEETRKERITNRGNLDRMELKDDEYFKKVIESYNKLSSEIIKDEIEDEIMIINTDRLTPEEIYKMFVEVLNNNNIK